MATDPSGECRVELRYRGVGRTHVDIVVTDKTGMRSYWAGAQNQESGAYASSSSGGFGYIAVNRNLDYKPGFVFYVSNPDAIQQVYYDDSDCPDKTYERKIWTTLQKIEKAKISYSPLTTNSNSAAFQSLREAGLGWKLRPKKKLPGWDINPFTGQRDPNTLEPSFPPRANPPYSGPEYPSRSGGGRYTP
jgi:hypothetical protein